ncbi:MAG: hypothetical protein J7518_10645 [Nocardioidaceae bacterium]|nr:hypothetical protein [Nocardioidaceae bacterium]
MTDQVTRYGLPGAAMARLREQARRLRGDHEFVVTFYDVLFTLRPELRPMFPEDLGAQRARFGDEFGTLVQALGDPEGFEQRGRALGRRHLEYGVGAEHYAKVRDVLVIAIAAHLGEECTAEDREAWSTAYDLIAVVMQKGAVD